GARPSPVARSAGDTRGPLLPGAPPAVRLDRLSAVAEPPDRAALARVHPVSSGFSRGSASDRARLLPALLPPGADGGAARPVARRGRAPLMPARGVLAFAGALAALAVLVAVAFSAGRYPVTGGELAQVVWSRITGGQHGLDPTIETIVFGIRGPRV